VGDLFLGAFSLSSIIYFGALRAADFAARLP
jgi:hypothetical protein